MQLARRFTLAMATVALGIYIAKEARSDEAGPVPAVPVPAAPDLAAPDLAAPDLAAPDLAIESPDEPMEIIPAAKLRATEDVLMVIINTDGSPVPNGISASEYSRVYDSIPFSRSEYKANPNYRHDSAMEILTGNSRHQTIIQHNFEHKQPVQRIPAPARPSRVLVPFSGFSNVWGATPWFWRY